MFSAMRTALTAVCALIIALSLAACDFGSTNPAPASPSSTLVIPNPSQAPGQQVIFTPLPLPTRASAPTAAPTTAADFLKRARNYIKVGNYEQAIADLNRVLELTPNDPAAYMDRGVAYFRSGDFATAMNDFNKAILLNPSSAEAYYNRGAAYFEGHDLRSAIVDFDTAISLKPDYDQAYFSRGYAKEQSGDKQGAMADYQKVLQISKNPALKSQAQNQLKSLQQKP